MEKIKATTKFGEEEIQEFTLADRDYLLIRAIQDLTLAITNLSRKFSK